MTVIGLLLISGAVLDDDSTVPVPDDGVRRRGIHHSLSGCEWDSSRRNPIVVAEEAPDGKLASLRRACDHPVSAPLDASAGVCTGAGVLIFPVIKRVQSEVPAPL